jgi:type VI secretion system protein ImpK
MSDGYGPKRGGRPPGRRPPRDDRFDDADDGYDRQSRGDEDDSRERPRGPRPRPGGARRPSGRPPAPRRQQGGSFWSRLFGSDDKRRRRPRRDERFDWDGAQDDGDDFDARGSGQFTRESWEDDDRDRGRGRGRDREGAPPKRRERKTLVDLCTPVFAYASVLPRDPGGMHPTYQQFRQEVMAALQRIESEAQEHGIEREDATDAVYALCLYLDGEVAASEWTGKMQWANEPLNIVKLQDPEGGVNFFRKLDEMGDRRRGVKEVYLVCLAMGFRGKYADLEPTQQAAKLGEIRQKVLRSMHPTPLDAMDELFPEAYDPAEPLVDDVPAPPKWWIAASFTIVAVALILYAVLFWAAGDEIRKDPASKLKAVDKAQASVVTAEVRG